MERLKNKVAIVTGAAGGMGLATAKLFFEEGAKVVATDIQEELLKNEISALGAGSSVFAMKQDVSSENDWKNVVKETIDRYGKIDILVNNAGILIAKGILDTDLDEWNKVLTINTTSVFLGSKQVIPHMQQNGKGSIINISSIAALVGSPSADGGDSAYSASKGAVRSFTKHIAQNFAKDKIRCNSVHPGGIYTPIMKSAGLSSYEVAQEITKAVIPLPPYLGEPNDIAYGILYLASDESRFITGTELVIDGGFITK